MLTCGWPDVEGMRSAVEYFAKAVSFVPNPGEVIGAFEKTLPRPVFSLLLEKIQCDIQLKVREYFEGLLPAGGSAVFAPTTAVEPGSERQVEVWAPAATRAVAVGSGLWEEAADVCSLSVEVADAEAHCEYCLGLLGQQPSSCGACGRVLYCSDLCRAKSQDEYHAYVCNRDDETLSENLTALYSMCRENRSSLALFMLRYVALLLTEELRGNGSANKGPFSHYDHLKPIFRSPSDTDRREAKLIRAIFSLASPNVVDCKPVQVPPADRLVIVLSDEIYTSMKLTVARNLIAAAPSCAADAAAATAAPLARAVRGLCWPSLTRRSAARLKGRARPSPFSPSPRTCSTRAIRMWPSSAPRPAVCAWSH